MKIAIAVWDKRVAPVFDICEVCYLFDSQEADEKLMVQYVFQSDTAEEKAEELLTIGTEHLLCGAIPNRIECFLISNGCKVNSFLSGEAEQVIDAFNNNRLDNNQFRMPGCCKRGMRNCTKMGRGLINENRNRGMNRKGKL